jgi:hypothetical protein
MMVAMKRLVAAVFSLSFLLPTVSFAENPSAFAVCRTLRNAERIACLGKHYGDISKTKFTVSSSSSSTSSSSLAPYGKTLQDDLFSDTTLFPEGVSCVRFTDARRAECRVKQLKEGKGKSASSSSSSTSSIPPRRGNCQRLPALEKQKCLAEAREQIDAYTRTVK